MSPTLGTMLLIEDGGRMVGRLVDGPHLRTIESATWNPGLLAAELTRLPVRPDTAAGIEIRTAARRVGSCAAATVTVRRAHASEGRRPWRARA